MNFEIGTSRPIFKNPRKPPTTAARFWSPYPSCPSRWMIMGVVKKVTKIGAAVPAAWDTILIRMRFLPDISTSTRKLKAEELKEKCLTQRHSSLSQQPGEL